MMVPCTHYQVLKTADGQGGVTTSRGEATAIWVDGPIPKEDLAVDVDSRQSISVGDELAFESDLI